MGIPAINQNLLGNLPMYEQYLYGAYAGMYPNCPSYTNNYMGGNFNQYYNPMMRANRMGYYNPSFTSYPQYQTSYKAQQPDVYQSSAQTSAKSYQPTVPVSDWNTIGEYYIKGMNPSESFTGAAVGGAMFGLINNPRMIVHPWNSLTSTRAVDKMFSAIKKNPESTLAKMWNNKLIVDGKEFKGGYELLSNAYSRMHKLEALNKSKLGLFRKSIKGVKTKDGKLLYDVLKAEMEAALKSGKPEEIAKATEHLKKVTNAFTGRIPNGLRKMHMQKPMTGLRKLINSGQYEPVEKLATKSLEESSVKSTLKGSLKHSCGIGSGLFFTAMEFLMDWGKIKNAFSKDKETGYKQLGQTTVKGAGSAVGWAIGEGIGAWAGAKLGAAAGTAISPGVGTAIGAIAGLIGGSIGMWLTGKVTHAIVGQDVGDKVEVENMQKTAQGRQQLLQVTMQQAMEDKNLDPKTAQALYNVASSYGMA